MAEPEEDADVRTTSPSRKHHAAQIVRVVAVAFLVIYAAWLLINFALDALDWLAEPFRRGQVAPSESAAVAFTEPHLEHRDGPRRPADD